MIRTSLTASTLAALALSAGAQSHDLIPSYHPNGPIAGGGDRIEFHAGEAFTIEASLPGLDHAASQAASAGWATLLLSSTSQLAAPLPITPTADLWLDPAQLSVLAFPPSLELAGSLGVSPGAVAIEVPTQTAAVDFNSPGAPLYLSAPIDTVLLPPAPSFPDRTIPSGSKLGGTESVFFDAPSNTYHLRHQLGGVVTDYLLDLDDPDLSKGTLSMTEATSGLKVLDDGGVYYAQGFGQGIYPPPAFQNFGTHTLTGHGISGKTVWMDWTDVLPKFGGG